MPLGSRAAVRVTGVSTKLTTSLSPDTKTQPRTFTVWFSNDTERIPLRVVAHTEYGDVEVRATSYTAPMVGSR